MSNNRNNFPNKKHNKYIKFINDISNNDLFFNDKDDLIKNRNIYPLEHSKNNNSSNIKNILDSYTLDKDENHYNSSKIKPIEPSKNNKSSISKKTDLELNKSITNIDKLLADTDKYLKDTEKYFDYRKIKPLDFPNNTNNEKNNIKSFSNYNKMNPINKTKVNNPLITSLDDSSFNLYNKTDNNKTDNDKTENDKTNNDKTDDKSDEKNDNDITNNDENKIVKKNYNENKNFRGYGNRYFIKIYFKTI